MTEIYAMYQGHKFWEKTLQMAAKCSWRAGPVLTQKMVQNDLTEKDELPEEYGFAPFIGFVFVDEKFRGKRLSQLLINNAISYARELGYRKIYIMSGEKGLYEKYGFVKLGDYRTVYDATEQLFVKLIIDL